LSGLGATRVAPVITKSGCREATSGLVGWLFSVVGDVSPSISDVGFGKAGTDRKSGVDLRSVGRRRRTSVDDVGR